PLSGDVTSPVWRGQVNLGRSLVPVATLGVDPATFGKVAEGRDDFGAGSLPTVVSSLRTNDAPEAVPLPTGARRISMVANITNQAGVGLTLRPAGRVSVRIVDGTGRPANLVVG